MSAPLPSPFLSPVLTPPSADSNNHEPDSDHHDSPHHHHHRKRERVKSFVKHLASPFSSPSPPQENGGPSNPTISSSSEPKRTPSVLHKRRSSVGSAMKNPPSPHSSPSPLPTPFPSPDVSKLSPNPNHSNPEIDHNGSPTRKRERVRSFVKNIRRTSSQLFKKDKKDHDPRKFALSALAAESLSVSTAATTPTISRRVSHSKHPSTGSMATTDTDYSETYVEVYVGSDKGSISGSVSEPIIEVPTPISPPVQPADAPVYPLGKRAEEEVEVVDAEPEPKVDSQPTENASGNSDPLQFPLPPSRPSSPTPVASPTVPVRTPVGEREADQSPFQGPANNDVEAPRKATVPGEDTTSREDTTPHEDTTSREDTTSHDDTTSRDDTTSPDDAASRDNAAPNDDAVSQDSSTTHGDVIRNDNPTIRDDAARHENESSLPTALENSSPYDQGQPPAPTDPVSTTPPRGQIPQTSPEPHSPTTPVPGGNDKGARDLCIPVLVPPMLFWPISNMRLSYVFTPLLTWWLSKGVLNYPSLYS